MLVGQCSYVCDRTYKFCFDIEGDEQATGGFTNRDELQTARSDAAGRLTGIALPNGVSSTLGYDLADRLTAITHAKGGATLEAIQYALNAVGNRTSMTDSAGTTTWGYDALDRLTSAAYPNADTVSYSYDAAGNRTSLTTNGVVRTNTFDAANRMTASGADTYSYDATGNQTGRTSGGVTTTYTYDALDRLTGIGGPVTAAYSYNGDGLRVAKTVGGTTTSYAWDITGLPQVLSDGNEYVWGRGLISQVTSVGGTTYAQADGLGSVRLLTDGAGTVVGTRQYDAFGASRTQTGTQLPFGYTGEQEDAESGLVYLRARYLDPASGRFLTRDPLPGQLADPRSQQAYSYVRNNPVRLTDPTGRAAQNTCGVEEKSLGVPDPNSGECKSIRNLIQSLIDMLAFRYDDMDWDADRLYENYHWRDGRRHPRSRTTWQGHQDKYEDLRADLTKAINDWIDAFCGGRGPGGGLPAGAEEWEAQAAPEKPTKRPVRDVRPKPGLPGVPWWLLPLLIG